MPKRSKLENHINTLRNMRSIITAMKNLALIEVGKINRCLNGQKQILTNIKQIASDFFNFYPKFLPKIDRGPTTVIILLGSERGFCGDVNDLILNQWRTNLSKQNHTEAKIIAIGSKLIAKAEDENDFFKQFSGPSTTEEMSGIILTLMRELQNTDPSSWVIICNELVENVAKTNLYNPLSQLKMTNEPLYRSPPILNLSPEKFFTDLVDEYLFISLYQVFYNSFLFENLRRAQQMEGALHWIDKSEKNLANSLNLIRQADITESIEEIMLSVEMTLSQEEF